MSVALTVVPAKMETVAQRVRSLQAEAKRLASDHVKLLIGQIVVAEGTAAEIAAGGDAYSPGIRDLARRFAEDCETRAQTLEAILARTS